MDETINGGEGRATRSLRKRLTSIESETTSRPGRPVRSVKLNTISETTTASPPRTTRSARQATTPLKTPAKRLSTLITDTVGSAETTPVKRLTRRRFSAVDNENNRQTLAKVTDCDPLAEKVRSQSVEIQPAEQSGLKTTKRKMRRPGPRSKTLEIIEEEQTFNTKKIETCIDLSGDNKENIAELSIKDPRDSKLVKQETHTVIDISEDQEEYDTIENSPNAKSLTKDMKLEAFDQHMIKEEDIPGKEENAIEADKSIDDDVSKGEEEVKRYCEEQSPLNVKRKTGDTTQMQSSTPIALHNSSVKTAQEFPKISLKLKAPAYDKDDSGNKSMIHFLAEKNLTSTESSLCPSPKLSFNEHSNLESSINEKKNENLLNENTKNKCHEKDDEATKTEAQNSLLKWTQPQAIGDITTNQKLDVIDIPIVDNSKDKNILAKIEIPTRCESRESMSLHFPSEEEAEEENQLQRNELTDDEAMEIDGYKSGDSLTYEERRELEENEIPIAGESLGSHTTTDDEENEDDNDEDTDDKEDSFIVPDDEEEEENIALEYSDNNEHISELKTNKKQYKRLQCLVDSSSSSENEKEKKPQDRKDNLESGNDSLLSYGEESTKKNGKDSNAISKLSNSAKCLSDSVGLDSDMNMDEKAETNQ
uniref:Uncharacterized protein n=1 Tax=Glossina pallidipes TaxID=7398 RepID=A0A1B0A9H5_GLOPL